MGWLTFALTVTAPPHPQVVAMLQKLEPDRTRALAVVRRIGCAYCQAQRHGFQAYNPAVQQLAALYDVLLRGEIAISLCTKCMHPPPSIYRYDVLLRGEIAPLVAQDIAAPPREVSAHPNTMQASRGVHAGAHIRACTRGSAHDGSGAECLRSSHARSPPARWCYRPTARISTSRSRIWRSPSIGRECSPPSSARLAEPRCDGNAPLQVPDPSRRLALLRPPIAVLERSGGVRCF